MEPVATADGLHAAPRRPRRGNGGRDGATEPAPAQGDGPAIHRSAIRHCDRGDGHRSFTQRTNLVGDTADRRGLECRHREGVSTRSTAGQKWVASVKGRSPAGWFDHRRHSWMLSSRRCDHVRSEHGGHPRHNTRRQSVHHSVARFPGTEGLRIAVVALPNGSGPQLAELLDVEGNILASQP